MLQYYDAEMRKYELDDHEKEYELPDGKIIKIGNELFRAYEIMFKPYLMGRVQMESMN